jgi:UDP-2,3-diacylglucosamine pyrophosphatase LpxH
MRRTWWRWLGAIATMVLSIRYVLTNVRPIILRPTADSTPELGGDTTALQIRRIIVSDLHLGAGDRLDDFSADREFADFVTAYVMTEPTELILAGDTFEFLQVSLPDVPDFEWTARAAERRLQTIMDAHPLVINALAEFMRHPHNVLTLLVGNHDFELHYQSAKTAFRRRLFVTSDDTRLRFGVRYHGDGIYIEHGNQFEQYNSFVRFEGISQPFELVRGTLAVKTVINPLERSPLPIAPFIDNVKPSSAFLWHLVGLARLRDWQVVMFVLRGVVLTVRSMLIPLSYRKSESLVESQTSVRHLENQRRLRRVLDSLRRILDRRFERQPDAVPAYLMSHIERESRRQLLREVREFNVSVLREMVRIAHQKENSETSLFVCGHTHMAQHVAMNERQTYVNVGTWTDVVVDLNTGKRQEQRCPFLQVRYAGDQMTHEFLVWRGASQETIAWSPEAIGRPRMLRRSQNPARFGADGVTITAWKQGGDDL